jgi:PKD repeat protein
MRHRNVKTVIGQIEIVGRIFLVLSTELSLFAGVLPAERTGQWLARTHVGVEGGIPNSSNMAVYTTIAAGASAATINTAINSCPSNQVVQLSAGSYSISSALSLKSGVVLRGAGMASTTLTLGSSGGVQILGADIYSAIANGSVAGSTSWTGGYTQGGSNIVVGSSSGMSVGMIVCLDQLNDNVDMFTTSYEGVSGAGRGNNRSQEQWATVKAINGTTVTIWPPVAAPNWRTGQTPQVWWITGWVQRAGLEDLTINGNSASGLGPTYANIYYYGCANCWLKNVKSLYGHTSHFNPYGAYRIEARHCHFEGTQSAAQMSYGICTFATGSSLFEDNIFNGIAGSMMSGQCENNCVWSYNYGTNNWYTPSSGWNMPMHWYHDAGPTMCLGEGNHGVGTTADWIHGPQLYCTDFRNRWTGWQPYSYGGGQTTADNIAICMMQANHYFSAVGNILGTSGKQSSYWLGPSQSYGNAIIGAGCYNGGYGYSSGDARTANTIFVDANYDTYGGSIRYNTTNADHALPASYVYTSKPSWFGDRPWPPFNPTNTTAAATSYTNIPAGYRFVFGVDPPSGPVSQPPVGAASGSPLSGTVPLTVSFSSAGSYDPEGATLSYSWTFGDGSTSTAINPSHTYGVAGTYRAQLQVSDGVNTSSSAALTITATNSSGPANQTPVAVASAAPSSGVAPLAVSFSSAGSSDPEGATLSYNWTFGDGTSSTLANATHTYINAGSYTAFLTVSDGTNARASSNLTISISPSNPGLATAVDFYLDMEAGANGQNITTNLLAACTHTTDSGGWWTLNGGPNESPIWNPVASTTGFTVISNQSWAAQLRSPVSVGGTNYGNSNHSRVFGYSLLNRNQCAMWHFGTQQRRVSVGYYYAMARGFSLNPVYINNILSVCMLDTNMLGSAGAIQGEFDIMGGGIWNQQAHVNVHSQAGGGYDTTQINIDKEKVYWVTQLWDGQNGICQVQVYDPSTWTQIGGTSTLALESNMCARICFGDIESEQGSNDYAVTNTFGNLIMDWTTAKFPLLLPAAGLVNQAPVAVANATPSSGVAPLAVAFSSVGSYDPEGATLTYSWSFGDGATSTAANPTHVYTTTGNYSASLTVSDGTNQISSGVMNITAGSGSSGLVAAYGFEEGSGNSVTDASGNGNNGAISGATWTSAGRYGRALSFSGNNSLVTVSDSASLHLSSALTLEAWVNPTNITGWKNLIFKTQGNNGLCYVLQGSSSSGLVPSLGLSISASNLMAPSPLPLNTWSHVAATYDGTTKTLYVNGTQVASAPQTGTIASSTDALTIGGNAFSGENWAGMIDEVRIYNRALSPAEVTADMNTPVQQAVTRPLPPSGLRVVSQ